MSSQDLVLVKHVYKIVIYKIQIISILCKFQHPPFLKELLTHCVTAHLIHSFLPNPVRSITGPRLYVPFLVLLYSY